MQLWYELLHQCETTLNLLRASRRNPKLSAYTLLEGEYNFNCTPLAPPGTKASVYMDNKVCTSWAPHAEDAWYIQPAMQHYRCYKFWIPETRTTRIAQTATFFPACTQMPTIAAEDMAIISARELVEALTKPQDKKKTNLAFKHTESLKQLADIFNEASTSARVSKNNTPPRVENNKTAPSMSYGATAPQNIKTKHTSINAQLETMCQYCKRHLTTKQKIKKMHPCPTKK